METTVKKLRGFALLPLEQRTAISQKGGVRAHELKLAHEFTSEEAREAGRKGGKATQERKRAQQAANAGQ